jgi:hypothetical protein
MQFVRDRWDVAKDEAFRDPSNLAAKLKQHQALCVELQGYTAHVVDVRTRITAMVERNHFAEATLTGMATELDSQWLELEAAATTKGKCLKEAESLALFNKGGMICKCRVSKPNGSHRSQGLTISTHGWRTLSCMLRKQS